MPTSVRGGLDRAALLKVAQQASAKMVFTDTRRVLNRARVLSPWDTGLLRANHSPELKVLKRGIVRGRVIVSTRYALAVHEGSRPHVIRAKRKKALRFTYRGRTVIVRSVNHPGNRSRPWLMTALREVANRRGYTVRKINPGSLAGEGVA